MAREAIAVPDFKNNRIQLSLRNYATHEMGKDQMSRDTRGAHRAAGAGCGAARADAAARRSA